ncbi:MAG: D-alanine--D-alanine ligase [Planctomycetes bacterium]|nr:D-alanine--D-alanine ligase [Planctomycetota bacterium]
MSITWRVTVLRGGPSAERDVSLASGAAVADACRRIGCVVTEADIVPDDLSALEIPADVVFPVLHGEFGEDGQLQGILEQRGLPYVGSDSTASRLAMDKNACKRRWRDVGLPTAPWICVDTSTDLTAVDHPDPPVVLKPLCEGSSIGIVSCATSGEVHAEVQKGVSKYGKVLVERRLSGPELTVGILENRALPVIEIRPQHGVYNYEAKYQRDDTQYLFQPCIDGDTYSLVQETSVQAFRALRCRDYGRVDCIVDEQDGVQLLEVNTIPGFTDHSLLPKAAAKVGIGFDELVGRLLRMAFERNTAL